MVSSLNEEMEAQLKGRSKVVSQKLNKVSSRREAESGNQINQDDGKDRRTCKMIRR
ncbi:hypothetical protein FRX31_028924, partial [Thalictrum thalictroides]